MKSAFRALALVALLAAPVAHASGSGDGQGQNQGSDGGTWRGGPIGRLDPAIPEPSAVLVFGVGLLTIGSAARRRHPASRTPT